MIVFRVCPRGSFLALAVSQRQERTSQWVRAYIIVNWPSLLCRRGLTLKGSIRKFFSWSGNDYSLHARQVMLNVMSGPLLSQRWSDLVKLPVAKCLQQTLLFAFIVPSPKSYCQLCSTRHVAFSSFFEFSSMCHLPDSVSKRGHIFVQNRRGCLGLLEHLRFWTRRPTNFWLYPKIFCKILQKYFAKELIQDRSTAVGCVKFSTLDVYDNMKFKSSAFFLLCKRGN